MMTQTNPFEGVETVAEMERPNPDAPTQRQVEFLERLVGERVCSHDGVPYAEAITDVAAFAAGLGRADCSKFIDKLLKEPKRGSAVPLGLHEVDGEVYKVQRSQGGNVYAKRLIQAGEGGWQYVGRDPLSKLSDATVLTRDRASAIGRRIGICCVCGALLTNEVSVREGIGPICGGRL